MTPVDILAAIDRAGGFTQWDRVGTISDFPVPAFDLPRHGGVFVDVGANWGRWAIAAALGGYDVVAVDAQLDACRVARRAAGRFGIDMLCVAADARRLPLRSGMVRMVHAYNVLQHFSRPDARSMVEEMHRILLDGGTAVVQAPNRMGMRSLYHQARRGFRPAHGFEIRYWSPRELRQFFERTFDSATVQVDGFFSQNPRGAPAHALPPRYRAVIALSGALTSVSRVIPLFAHVADSLRVIATKRD